MLFAKIFLSESLNSSGCRDYGINPHVGQTQLKMYLFPLGYSHSIVAGGFEEMS